MSDVDYEEDEEMSEYDNDDYPRTPLHHRSNGGHHMQSLSASFPTSPRAAPFSQGYPSDYFEHAMSYSSALPTEPFSRSIGSLTDLRSLSFQELQQLATGVQREMAFRVSNAMSSKRSKPSSSRALEDQMSDDVPVAQ